MDYRNTPTRESRAQPLTLTVEQHAELHDFGRLYIEWLEKGCPIISAMIMAQALTVVTSSLLRAIETTNIILYNEHMEQPTTQEAKHD